MSQQGRPTQPGEATPMRRRTFTGNRALDMEEALIFESGRLDATGVDIDEPEPFADRLGEHARVAPIGLPGLTEPETIRHYLEHNIHYILDAPCERSIVAFRRLAGHIGVLDPLPQLPFLTVE